MSATTDTQIGLIIVGDEILSGRRTDKHLQHVASTLAARGLRLAWCQILPDDPASLVKAFQDAFASDNVVFSIGGIGATPDDHTRQAAGVASGRRMELNAEAEKMIIERMRKTAASRGQAFDPHHPRTAHGLNMGVLPVGATLIDNPYNQIPGFAIDNVYFLPGFPAMAWPMIDAILHHRFSDLSGAGRGELSVRVAGLLESEVTSLLIAVETHFKEVKVFCLPSLDDPAIGPHLEVGVRGITPDLDDAYEHLLSGLGELGAHFISQHDQTQTFSA